MNIEPEASGVDSDLQTPTIKTYRVRGASTEVALSVVSQLLSGNPNVRVALDGTSNKLVVQGLASDHETVENAIKILEGEGVKVKVIDMKTVDPQSVVVLANKIYGLEEEGAAGPKLESDSIEMKLFVRGTESEISEIEELVAKLEGPSEDLLAGENRTLRLIPMTDTQADQALSLMPKLWEAVTDSGERIQIVTPSELRQSSLFQEQEVSPESENEAELKRLIDEFNRQFPDRFTPANPVPDAPLRFPAPSPADNSAIADQGMIQYVSFPAPTQEKPPARPKGNDEIIISKTPKGLVVGCNDPEKLARFEKLVREVMGVSANSDSTLVQPSTIYYLRYAKVDEAAALLKEILQASSGAAGMLGGFDPLGDMLGPLGALIPGGGGGGGGGGDTSSAIVAGSLNIVPDPRLNRLWVSGLPEEVALVGEILTLIDKPKGPSPVETLGKARSISIRYTTADRVAKIVKEALADRITQAAGGQGGGQGQPSPQDILRALQGGRGGRGGRGGGGGGDSSSPTEPPKMTIAVDDISNSVIVVAPDALFEEVQTLVASIDQPTADSNVAFAVMPIANQNIANAMAAMFGQTASGASTSAPQGASSAAPTVASAPSSAPSGGDDAAAAEARRAAFINAIRGGALGGGGRGGAPGGGGPPGGFGGGRGGGGGPGGGGGRGGGGRGGGGRGGRGGGN